jgi:hypothetical protein
VPGGQIKSMNPDARTGETANGVPVGPGRGVEAGVTYRLMWMA